MDAETVIEWLETASRQELGRVATAMARAWAARPVPDSALACMREAARFADLLDAGEAGLTPLVARVDSTGEAKSHGFSGTRAWLTVGLAARRSTAADRLALARTLHRLPQVARRVEQARLPVAYAAAICHAVRHLDDAGTALAEQTLLGLAEQGGTVEQIRKAGEKALELLRGDAPDSDTRKGFADSWLQVSESLDGGAWLKGWLDAELKQLLQSKLDPLTSRTASAGAGTRDKRNAAALRTLLTRDGRGQEAVVVITLRDTQADGTPVTGVSRPGPRLLPPAATDVVPGPVPLPPGDTGLTPGPAAEPQDLPAARLLENVVRLPRRPGPDPTPGSGYGTTPQTGPATAPTRTTRFAAGTGPPVPVPDPGPPDDAASGEPARARTGDGTAPDACGPAPFGAVPADAHDIGTKAGSGADPECVPGMPVAAGSGTKGAGRWEIASAHLSDGTPIDAAQAKRIALSHGISVLLLSGDGRPLFLGRRVRFASDAQRLVLAARYSTCAVDECDIPAHACEVDHVTGWEFGGKTDVSNLAPLCGFHNRDKADHPGAYTVSPQPGGTVVYRIDRPPWMRRHAA
ncbi:HNH endonuclease signature motif containing protein [Rhizohabitans arisaemae]|uniref:HNH endonuclease signature motif containing protein n=1 Tax=Rhizohabitans arisaemae TaxID=2720610 RepID=UPI0024B0C6FB|nr:HNH endonuclease signature motif containing protein [Rhizohabitans arisaemae]